MIASEIVSNGSPETLTAGVDQQDARAAESTRAAANLPGFPGVHTRFLRPDERSQPAQLPSLPLVLEAQEDSGQPFLECFLREHGEALVAAIHDHGAVLLRGFSVASEKHFEAAISSVPSLRPMGGYFMAERGRTPVRPGSKVYHTNTIVRTGGGYKLPGRGFHTENYESTDIPGFICFWCKQPAWLGGETAISQLSRAYAQLDDVARQRLENRASYQVKFWPLEAVARRYAVTSRTIRRNLEAIGVPIVEEAGQVHVSLEKPAVVQHPSRARKCLLVNLSVALPGFNDVVVERFLPAYSGWAWAAYRQAWKRPRIHRVGQVLTNLLHVFASPQAVHHYLRVGWTRWVSREPPEMRPKRPAEGSRLSDHLNAEDVRTLADAVWRNSSVFTWKQGDVLILDNLQVAHTGMPGWGPRALRAMLCNPIGLRSEGGVPQVDLSSEYRSIHDRLCELNGGDRSSASRADTT